MISVVISNAGDIGNGDAEGCAFGRNSRKLEATLCIGQRLDGRVAAAVKLHPHPDERQGTVPHLDATMNCTGRENPCFARSETGRERE